MHEKGHTAKRRNKASNNQRDVNSFGCNSFAIGQRKRSATKVGSRWSRVSTYKTVNDWNNSTLALEITIDCVKADFGCDADRSEIINYIKC